MQKKQSTKSGAKRIARIALFTALTAACAQISIPLPGGVPITLQTLAVMLAAAILRWDGVFVLAAYLFLGLVGVPVFSNFGSTANLFSPTGGFLVGFLPMAAVIAAISKFSDLHAAEKEQPLAGEETEADEKREKERKRREQLRIFIVTCIASFVGTVVCYAFGTAWFIGLNTFRGTEKTVAYALSACVVPFIVPDLLKIALASYLTSVVCTRLKNLLK